LRDTNTGGAVTEWRAACLRRRGFGAELAGRVAGDARYDLHALLELLDRGCPPDLAERILAPLDGAEPGC